MNTVRTSTKREYKIAPKSTGLKNIIAELKNYILKGFNSILDNIKDKIRNLKTGQWKSSKEAKVK